MTKPKGLRITSRDLDMLQSLSIARFLTTNALDWLHFPTWEQRLQRFHNGTIGRYRPQTSLYDRLRRLETTGLIHRIIRPVMVSIHTFQRHTDVWCLAEDGAALLIDQRGLDSDRVQAVRMRQRSFIELEHAVSIGTLYAALQTKIASMSGVVLEGWQGDHVLNSDHDRIPVRVPSSTGGTHEKELSLIPDATCQITFGSRQVRIFVEIDRGRSVKSWRDKIRAYRTYTNHPALQERYGVTNFVLLTLTTTQTQQRKLMQATAEMLEKPTKRYLFSLCERIHPHTIGDTWNHIVTIEHEPCHHPNGIPYRAIRYQTAQHTLLASG